MCDFFSIESTGEDVLTRQYRLLEQPDVATERIYTGEVARLHSLQSQRPPYDAKNPYLATIKVNRELHRGGDRSCMHIEFDIDGSKMRYESGDHVAIYPVNDSDLVAKLGSICSADLDAVFSLINTDLESSKKHPFPCPTTYRTALTHYLEITALPRTHILRELVEYCSDEKDKEFLRLISSTTPEGKFTNRQVVVDVVVAHNSDTIRLSATAQARPSTSRGSRTRAAASCTSSRTSSPASRPSITSASCCRVCSRATTRSRRRRSCSPAPCT